MKNSLTNHTQSQQRSSTSSSVLNASQTPAFNVSSHLKTIVMATSFASEKSTKIQKHPKSCICI